MKKKILFVVEAMGGGVFTYLVSLANHLADRYDISIAYALRSQTPINFKEYFDPRIRLIRVRSFCRAIRPSRDIRAFFELRRLVREIRPDVIHFHSSKAGALGRLACSSAKSSLFYTPHGYSFLMEDQHPLKRDLFRMIETVCAKRNCVTISCSQGEHHETLKMTRRSAWIDNGVDVEELDAVLAGLEPAEERPFTVFTLGRICRQKNPALFNAIALAMPDIRFVWVGDGELRSQLTAPNIRVTGWTERKEALRWSMEGDVFLLTSLWEGMPMSLLEAMYMQKLCVVSDVIGNRDVIRTGENGFVCRDKAAYIRAIRAGQRGEADPLAARARRDVLETYNTTVMASRYSQLYEMEELPRPGRKGRAG